MCSVIVGVVTEGDLSVVGMVAVAMLGSSIERYFFNVSLAVCASSDDNNKYSVFQKECRTGELSGFTLYPVSGEAGPDGGDVWGGEIHLEVVVWLTGIPSCSKKNIRVRTKKNKNRTVGVSLEVVL